jgi:plastocyanin
MKNCNLLIFPLFIFLLVIPLGGQTKHIIEVSDFEFTPSDINITVGDTVLWQWIEGMHTTTSDAVTGPDTWDAIIDQFNPTFSIVITAPGLHRYYCIPHGGPNGIGMAGTINASNIASAIEDNSIIPASFSLFQNYPNPFNPETNIKFIISKKELVSLKVYNILGNEVAVLLNEVKPAGLYIVKLNGENLSSGVYFYTLTAGNFKETRKMILAK